MVKYFFRFGPRTWFQRPIDLDDNEVDESFYVSQYPDVAASSGQPREHFYRYGWKEGRNPSASFNTLYYARRHLPDGALTENPLLHYRRLGGRNSGLDTRPLDEIAWLALQRAVIAPHFDAVYYGLRYADMIGSMDALDHFLSVGGRKRLNPRPDFDTASYIAHHEHVERSGANPFYHAIAAGTLDAFGAQMARASGLPTGRSPASLDVKAGGVGLGLDRPLRREEILRQIAEAFDRDFYLRKYADVRDAQSDPLIHFHDFGWKERRDPSAFFNTRYYLDRYGDEIPAGTNPLHHYVAVGKALGYHPNPIGSVPWDRPVAPAPAAWRDAIPARGEDADVVVIVPVYRGLDDTLATIHAVLTHRQRAKFSLLVINDCSPEPELTDRLRALARDLLFIYVENERNLGFVGSVNRAIAMVPKADVILLNADTLVFGDWIDRMLAHAAADPRIATITPYSNNASICSYPNANEKNALKLECALAQIDAYAAACNPLRRTELPTGVGFCFYMRRSVIDAIGPLDPAFGRGYGEENDFCLRAIKAGYRNVLAEDIFVFHSGEVSFAEFREAEYIPGQEVLIGKHPDYARRVQAFIAADPGWEGRARLDLYRLARRLGPGAAVLFTFSGSGGIATHVNHLAGRLREAGASVLIVTVDGNAVSLNVFDPDQDLYVPAIESLRIEAGTALLETFLRWLDPAILHVHSFTHASWRATENLMRLLTRFGDRLYVTLHDFNAVCHRSNMVTREGRSRHGIDLEACALCVATDRDVADQVPPQIRMRAWEDFLSRTRANFAPSEDTRARFRRFFPNVAVAVRPHEEVFPAVAPFEGPPAKDGPLRIVTIGAIGPHKGSDLIYSLALDAKARDLPIAYSIVGYSAITRDMTALGVMETGEYRSEKECLEMVKMINPHFGFFPSIWPETYCYSLSSSFFLGLPPVAFDLGAQSERIRESQFGVVLPTTLMDEPQAINDALLALSVEDEWARNRGGFFTRYANFPEDYYGPLEEEPAPRAQGFLRRPPPKGRPVRFQGCRD
ncbi:glycosyltransferase [Methylobacterium organophilum]|uniref:Glycosyltransferase n=1 Tax=Methylobacterium organophilum TaxID=410 RepID=A0ABQ4T6H4_METOR|nr:glycosyltransferase [Methylobacterium organophilum]GJE25851.1 hypothetical protein LKMONMHP_0694 [Methylobacterium organophilum]